MVPPCKYKSDEERINAYKMQQNNYSMKDWKCVVCDCSIKIGNKTKHLKSKKHIRNQLPACGVSDSDSNIEE
jgi:hypothetical protein